MLTYVLDKDQFERSFSMVTMTLGAFSPDMDFFYAATIEQSEARLRQILDGNDDHHRESYKYDYFILVDNCRVLCVYARTHKREEVLVIQYRPTYRGHWQKSDRAREMIEGVTRSMLVTE